MVTLAEIHDVMRLMMVELMIDPVWYPTYDVDSEFKGGTTFQ